MVRCFLLAAAVHVLLVSGLALTLMNAYLEMQHYRLDFYSSKCLTTAAATRLPRLLHSAGCFFCWLRVAAAATGQQPSKSEKSERAASSSPGGRAGAGSGHWHRPWWMDPGLLLVLLGWGYAFRLAEIFFCLFFGEYPLGFPREYVWEFYRMVYF
jgi:hypothetical protein